MNQKSRHPLRLNVGFLLHQSVGFSRVFEFDHPSVQVAGEVDAFGLRGELRFTRTGQGLYAEGRLEAQIAIECVRCLTPLHQTVVVELSDLFVYPPERADDPLLAIPETGILDLNPLLREYLLLNTPMRPPVQRGLPGVVRGLRKQLERDDV